MNTINIRIWVVSVIAIAVFASPVSSQEKSSPSTASRLRIDEVMVTANRREELSQNTPVAITAFTPDQLQEQNVQTSQDLMGLVPSLIVGPAGTYRNTETFTIRGQGATFGAAPGVVTYFAETAGPRNSYTMQQGVGMYYDLANIQVLKGPQGTLFGKNTTGGAVLIEPNKPVNHNEGYIQLGAGNYHMREIEGAVNVALIPDTLMVRGAFWKSDRDGFTREINTGTDLDNRSRYSGRVGITFNPTDRLSNYLLAYDYHADERITGRVVGALNPARFPSAAIVPGTTLTYQQVVDQQRARGPRRVRYDSLPYDRTRTWGLVDQLSFEINDAFLVKNILSYARLQNVYNSDEDGSIAPIGGLRNASDQYVTNVETGTEELQLQGKLLNDDLTFVAGVYADFHRPISDQHFLGDTFVPEFGISFPYEAHPYEKRKSAAVFAQSTYDLGNANASLRGLRLTTGIRYTRDKMEARSDFLKAIYESFGITAPAISASSDDSSPSWTVGLDYQVNPELLTYAKVSRGYKAGGFSGFAAREENASFDPEYVTNYELGIKSDWQLGSMPVRLNLAAYHTDYEDIQRSSGDFDPATNATGSATFNAAAATIRGVELEMIIQPLDGLDFSVNYSHLLSEYSDYEVPATIPTPDCSSDGVATGAPGDQSADLSCTPFAIPKNQLSTTLRYSTEISPQIGSIGFGATLNYTSEQKSAAIQSAEPFSTLDSYQTLNLNAEWRNTFGKPLDLTFFMTNVTDKTYKISSLPLYSSAGYVADIYGEPRMYGLKVRYRFGNN